MLIWKGTFTSHEYTVAGLFPLIYGDITVTTTDEMVPIEAIIKHNGWYGQHLNCTLMLEIESENVVVGRNGNQTFQIKFNKDGTGTYVTDNPTDKGVFKCKQ